MKRYSQQQISDLLDKFMDGLTTPQEEALLADYFRTEEVPQEWEDYRLMFDYFDRGMEGELITPQEPSQSLTHLMGRRWWGIAAAATIAAVIVALVVKQQPESSTVTQPPVIVKAQPIDTPEVAVPEVEEMQHLASVSPSKPASHGRAKATTSRTRRLQAQNAKLARENERLQRELADLKRRAFIIDLEANGYKAVMNEDGSIVLIDLEQEIENELNNQPTSNIPSI